MEAEAEREIQISVDTEDKMGNVVQQEIFQLRTDTQASLKEQIVLQQERVDLVNEKEELSEKIKSLKEELESKDGRLKEINEKEESTEAEMT